MDEQAARDRSPAPVAVQPGHGPSPERFESFYLREFRKVVALTYALSGSGLVAEVAATLGLAEGTVKAHLSRARRALSQQLATSGEETP